ncbi:Suppressor protein SRP40-like [Caenorhabditis elegans]|uniref:Suppressor protein SRP40-like n=1 Tax=Caenorhabditis elegans TaxID=6239 RepID=B2MZB9_CAEEL|nr:Suppressor protein SRP40-like [Caenorhabditis elegans]CAQ48390.1 Suppressor protein SRP40-like [Caenorhabditis elegans]|eukprot:NP_001129851.1 Uncharacterized protein CELE_C47E12.11 [Caenorhabditis elegans]
MIRRARSWTRLDRHINGLTIYYKRREDDVEEKMVRVTLFPDAENSIDSLCSVKSLPPRSASSNSKRQSAGSTAKSKNKTKSEKSKKTKSRGVHVAKKWRKFKKTKKESETRLDDDTIQTLDDLKTLNSTIRKRFHIGTTCPHGLENLKSKSRADQLSFSFKTGEILVKNLNAHSVKEYDCRGISMINPVAQTPFPNACSVETRQRAREKMKALAKRGMDSNDLASSTSSKHSTKKTNTSDSYSDDMSPVFLTRVSSDTRFPGATSPATCERVRLMLKEYALREHIKDSDYTGSHSKNSKSSKKKNTQTDSKSTKSKSLSMKTTYSESSQLRDSDSCSEDESWDKQKSKKDVKKKKGTRGM